MGLDCLECHFFEMKTGDSISYKTVRIYQRIQTIQAYDKHELGQVVKTSGGSSKYEHSKSGGFANKSIFTHLEHARMNSPDSVGGRKT